jgi:hypothetical protein
MLRDVPEGHRDNGPDPRKNSGVLREWWEATENIWARLRRLRKEENFIEMTVAMIEEFLDVPYQGENKK